MADALQTGKICHLGLSNVTTEQIRRADAVHRICAVQYEHSLWRKEAETDFLSILMELGIALVGRSPLGSRFLTGNLDKLDEADFHNVNPKMSGDDFETN